MRGGLDPKISSWFLNPIPDTSQCDLGEFTDMLQNNFPNSGTCTLNEQLCAHMTLGSQEPIKGS